MGVSCNCCPFGEVPNLQAERCGRVTERHSSTHHLPAEVGNDRVQGPLQRSRERSEVLREVALAHQRQRGETLGKSHVVPWFADRVGRSAGGQKGARGGLVGIDIRWLRQ